MTVVSGSIRFMRIFAGKGTSNDRIYVQTLRNEQGLFPVDGFIYASSMQLTFMDLTLLTSFLIKHL